MSVVLISAFLAMLRAIGVKNQSFQAVAHLWMGGLITLWWLGGPASGFYLWLIVVLSAVEIICFFVYHKPARPRYSVED